MPQSRFNRMKKMMGKKEIKVPEQISEHCLGKCDIQMFGVDPDTKKPRIYCNGCGRNMGR